MRFCETCSNCKLGLMIHNGLYTWKCNHCGFSYQIDPAGKTPKITIICRGNIPKVNIYYRKNADKHEGVKC